MENNEKRPLKNIVKDIFGKLDSENKGVELITIWEKTFEEDIVKHTKLVSFSKGRLVVNVSDSSRLYELTLRRYELIKKLNRSIKKGKVKEIRFKIGEM